MPLTAAQIDAIMTVIRETAAAKILPRFRNLDAGDIASKAHAADLVTIADREAEEMMTERFQAILPDAVILGEEAVSAGTASLAGIGADRAVVIDPIDGTWNFAHGISNFGVLVAVVEAGQTVWGCCYDAIHDDWVAASLGGGTWFYRNGDKRRLRTRAAPPVLAQMRGNLGEYFMPAAQRTSLARLIPQIALHNTLGASVMEYRQMALGGVDFCLTAHLNVWDHAAGVLCLREAGGVSRLLDGRPYDPAMVTADSGGRAHLLNARSAEVWDVMAGEINGYLG